MTPEAAAIARNDECRRTVLAHLYARPAVAQAPDTIARILRVQHDFAETEVASACAFLLSAGFVELVKGSMSGLKHYRITAAGTVEHESSRV